MEVVCWLCLSFIAKSKIHTWGESVHLKAFSSGFFFRSRSMLISGVGLISPFLIRLPISLMLSCRTSVYLYAQMISDSPRLAKSFHHIQGTLWGDIFPGGSDHTRSFHIVAVFPRAWRSEQCLMHSNVESPECATHLLTSIIHLRWLLWVI